MSTFYKLAYAVGFTPWENAVTHTPAADQITALFDRKERERAPPYGSAFPNWTIVDESPFDATGLPAPLRNVDPRCYRLKLA